MPHRVVPTSLASAPLLAVIAGLAAPAAAQPTIVGIEPFSGGDYSEAHAINADGTMVTGSSNAAPGANGHAIRWTLGGGLEDLGLLPGGTASSGYAISADGSVIAGTATVTTGSNPLTHAFRWTAATGIVDLGVFPGGTLSRAEGISADGSVVVGYSNTGAGTFAFRWTAAGGMQSLGTFPGGTYSYAYGVSADGLAIAGFGNSATATPAFRWTAQAGFQSTGTFPGAPGGSFAFGISGDGQVVTGFAQSEEGTGYATSVAFGWSPSYGLQSLGRFPGHIYCYGSGLNTDGSAAVGTSYIPTPYLARAFLWTPALGIVDLNTYLPTLGANLTGWTLNDADAVSADSGSILGYGTLNGGNRAWVVRGLHVGCYPNCDSSTTAPLLNVNDFICFLNRFAAGQTYANCDQSTTPPILNVSDFACFLNAFAAGCGS